MFAMDRRDESPPSKRVRFSGWGIGFEAPLAPMGVPGQRQARPLTSKQVYMAVQFMRERGGESKIVNLQEAIPVDAVQFEAELVGVKYPWNIQTRSDNGEKPYDVAVLLPTNKIVEVLLEWGASATDPHPEKSREQLPPQQPLQQQQQPPSQPWATWSAGGSSGSSALPASSAAGSSVVGVPGVGGVGGVGARLMDIFSRCWVCQQCQIFNLASSPRCPNCGTQNSNLRDNARYTSTTALPAELDTSVQARKDFYLAVQAFLSSQKIEFHAIQQFLQLTPQQQLNVMARGSLHDARDPTAVLISRMTRSNTVVERRAGDWICPTCGDFQFQKNLVCRSCGTPNANPVPPRPAPSPNAFSYKRKLCFGFMRGQCNKGDNCTFAHGDEEAHQRR